MGSGVTVSLASEGAAGVEHLLAAFAAAYERRDFARLAALIHPDGCLVTRARGGGVVRGREAWIEHLRALELSVYEVTIARRHVLDDSAVVEEGRMRYPLEHGGFADEAVAWLLEFEDGMLHRATPYRHVDEARAARAAALAGAAE